MHYALVSDLLTKEAFDERVEKKAESLGGLVDEVTAAMLVVDELGRSHIKIKDIPSARTSLVSFFGKILEIRPPHEFTREGEEPGLVASVVLGDPTGTVTMSLWDERAQAASELMLDSVIEVIGKPRPGRKEVTCIALRESSITIVETKKPPTSEIMASPLVGKILVAFDAKEITRRDGTPSTLQEFIIGDASGTARLVCWEPGLFSDVDEGACVSITGVQRKEEDGIVEYVVSDAAIISILPDEVSVLTKDADEVTEGQTSVVTGVVTSVSDVRTFITRRGTESRVKNVQITGSSKKTAVNVALWGDAADALFLPGDSIQVVNAPARLNRYGSVELSVGRGSAIRTVILPGERGSISGMVIPRPEGLSLDDGKTVWMLFTEESPTPGTCIQVTGICRNGRIYAETITGCLGDVGSLTERLNGLL